MHFSLRFRNFANKFVTSTPMHLFSSLKGRIAAVVTAIAAMAGTAAAQTAAPVMYVTADDGTETDETRYDGSAPMTARFEARPQDVGAYQARYEWRFTRQGQETPFLVRYDENTSYTFTESGQFSVELMVTFTLQGDTIEYVMDEPFSVSISESRLELPNVFTPNGDGINDVYRVKEGYKSIISFEATVFSRWGRKIYTWTDLEGGWDGRSGGSECPAGAYYLVVKAQGADGRRYNIKKTINILRGYSEDTGGGSLP